MKVSTTSPEGKESVLCVATPDIDAYCETFVREQIRRLPFKVRVLHGWPLRFDENGSDLRTVVTSNRMLHRIGRRFLPSRSASSLDDVLDEWFRANSVGAVLAQKGHTAASLVNACRLARIPLIAHFHGADVWNEDVIRKRFDSYQTLFKACSAIIAVSREMQARLCELGAPAESVHWNPCSVDPDVFADSTPAEVGAEFISVGRFVDKKAPQLTLLAFAQVLKECPEARLTMVGDGPLWESCIELANALSLNSHVTFAGAKDSMFVADAMRLARVYVQHSVRTRCGDAEGTPVGVIEAQASGLPVVSTRHMGIGEVVVEGETGFLVKERDVNAMAEKMVQLAKYPQLAATLGAAGRIRVMSEYSHEKRIGRLAEIIEQASAGRLQRNRDDLQSIVPNPSHGSEVIR